MTQRKERDFDPWTGPYTLDGIGVLLYGILQELDIIKKIMIEKTRLDGRTITNTFILPGGGASVTKIDFVEAEHAGVPAGVSLEVPLHKIADLSISNLGPGLVLYSTNRGLSQFEAAEPLLPGESTPSGKFHFDRRCISQLNLVANDVAGFVGPGHQTAKVRVTVLV